MKTKNINRAYWIVTVLFSIFMLLSGITEAIQHESGLQIMEHLGYPAHVLIILGTGKILAAIALVQNKFKILKEWAYAGLTFNFIGACVARADAGDSWGLVVSPLIFMAIMFTSYILWKKAYQYPAVQLRMEPTTEPIQQIA